MSSSDSCLLLYPDYILECKTSGGNSSTPDRPVSNIHDGYLSRNGAKRLRKAVSWLHAATPVHKETNPETGKRFNMRLNFITLTLCAQQEHDDKTIKSRMLEPFIDNLRRRYKLKAYLWRAEAQKNDNIHFHLVTNRFMNLYVIRRLWNKRQAALGYIKKYRDQQQDWHKYGFKSRPWLYKQWCKKSQFKAWKHGLSTNWSDPNSTDIHALNKVHNAAGYIAKYMTKTSKATCNKCHTDHYFSDPVPVSPQCRKCGHHLSIERERPIQGRIWFISRSLSNIKPPKIKITSTIEAELFLNSIGGHTPHVLNDFVSIYRRAPSKHTLFNSSEIKQAYEQHIKSIQDKIW